MSDFPLRVCAALALEQVLCGATVHQKWTCSSCGSRQTMEEENTFYTAGICEECKKVTKIKECGFLLHKPIDHL